jgi:tRNA nucleotidyltransferase (CCA-adding enzyme)
VTLEEDLARRDLTINAMALGPDNTVIDPHGGLADLENKVLRHVSSAFVEDPIRVLRLARFAARYKHLGFKVAPETLELAQALRRAGELNTLTPERVWQETWKALSEKDPADYFQILKRCGGLAILFPEIEALFGIPSLIQGKHGMDSGMHALLALQNAARLSPSPEVRFAALMHSLGKALTLPSDWPEHKNYQDYTEEALIPLADRYKIPRHVRELAKIVGRCHLMWESAVTPETILEFYDACDALRRPERFENILLACEACFITHHDPDHSEFLLNTLHALQECLKNLRPTLANAGQPLKNIYRQVKLDCLKKLLSPTA